MHTCGAISRSTNINGTRDLPIVTGQQFRNIMKASSHELVRTRGVERCYILLCITLYFPAICFTIWCNWWPWLTPKVIKYLIIISYFLKKCSPFIFIHNILFCGIFKDFVKIFYSIGNEVNTMWITNDNWIEHFKIYVYLWK